jgi:hypothetical protein
MMPAAIGNDPVLLRQRRHVRLPGTVVTLATVHQDYGRAFTSLNVMQRRAADLNGEGLLPHCGGGAD